MNIDKFLISLNFDASQKGFQYWKDALNYCKDKSIFKMMDVYNSIAEKYNSSHSSVEIAMRRCVLNVNYITIAKYITSSKRKKTNKRILIALLKMQKEKNKIDFHGNNEDLAMLLISAVRYARGRKTYIVGWTCKTIKNNLNILSDKDKEVMIRDIKNILPYGDDWDKKEWELLLKKIKK